MGKNPPSPLATAKLIRGRGGDGIRIHYSSHFSPLRPYTCASLLHPRSQNFAHIQLLILFLFVNFEIFKRVAGLN